jgi:hypothetical protein
MTDSTAAIGQRIADDFLLQPSDKKRLAERIAEALEARAPASPMPDIDIGELKRLAEAATPGPWATEIIPWGAAERKLSPIQWTGLYVGREDDERPGKVLDTFIEGNVVAEPAGANAAFIAAFNPQTALALIDRVEAAEGDADALSSEAALLRLTVAGLRGGAVPAGWLEGKLKKIANTGQSIEPDHWQFRCMARETAQEVLDRLAAAPADSGEWKRDPNNPGRMIRAGEKEQEPVAWQRRLKGPNQYAWGEWRECSLDQASYANEHGHPIDFPSVQAQVRPLFATPQSPSVAALVEALREARRGMKMVHGAIADPTRPRQACGEVAAHWLERIDAALSTKAAPDVDAMPTVEEIGRTLHAWIQWKKPFEELDGGQRLSFNQGAHAILALFARTAVSALPICASDHKLVVEALIEKADSIDEQMADDYYHNVAAEGRRCREIARLLATHDAGAAPSVAAMVEVSPAIANEMSAADKMMAVLREFSKTGDVDKFVATARLLSTDAKEEG